MRVEERGKRKEERGLFVFKVKPIDKLIAFAGRSCVVITCEGCREIYFPDDDVKRLISYIESRGALSAVFTFNYVCNPDNIAVYMQEYPDAFSCADTVLVVSCGVGVQVVSEVFSAGRSDTVSRTCNRVPLGNIVVAAACDTYQLNGYQGLLPSRFGCALCGECHLNDTAGICPVTSCSKGLVNGQCGGAKNGMCEVDSNIECGWERIYKRRFL